MKGPSCGDELVGVGIPLLKVPPYCRHKMNRKILKSCHKAQPTASAMLPQLHRLLLTATSDSTASSSGTQHCARRKRRRFLPLRFPGQRSVFDCQCLGSDID
ncbi:hypothetical protein TNCT_104941 [Trichonephila clavata]|uniref:Uncharacterized protein n=1 Tax=Trichonephila clavata TaxID=2740835 RepID=A0A8X6KJZ7_TRICU|nr:hypothetical protein TNCT_104941 [Trichonephila clavata]